MTDIKRSYFEVIDDFPDETIPSLFHVFNKQKKVNLRIETSQLITTKIRKLFPQQDVICKTVTLKNGLSFRVDTSDIFAAQFLFGFLNESLLLNAINCSLPEQSKVVDIGANFGLYCIHAAHVSGEKSQIVAFEPVSTVADLCQGNIETNKLISNVTLIRKAVGRSNGAVDFFIARDSAFSGLHDTKRSKLSTVINVPITTLDANPSVQALGGIDFLKIDVEGHEADVFAGAKQTIKASPNILIVMEYSYKNLLAVPNIAINAEIDWLFSHKFFGYIYSDNGLVPFSKSMDIPKTLSGTLIMAASGCQWLSPLLSAIKNGVTFQNQAALDPAIEFLLEKSILDRALGGWLKAKAYNLGAKNDDNFTEFIDTHLNYLHTAVKRTKRNLSQSIAAIEKAKLLETTALITLQSCLLELESEIKKRN